MGRGKEFQLAASTSLGALKREATEFKKRSILAKDGDSANAVLGFERAIDGVSSELMMWVKLKDDDPNSAWSYLVDAQVAITDAIQAHASFGHLSEYAGHLDVLEKILFPPQTFVSIGTIAASLECSVCGKESGECDHVPGRPYMGEFCYKNVKGMTMTEVSIVENPGSKHHRITEISDGRQMRDLMTWRVTTTETKKAESPK